MGSKQEPEGYWPDPGTLPDEEVDEFCKKKRKEFYVSVAKDYDIDINPDTDLSDLDVEDVKMDP